MSVTNTAQTPFGLLVIAAGVLPSKCMTDAADREYRAELTTFQCKECYVYRPPPASSIGHRAEFWDVDHWLQVKIACCPNLPANLPVTLTDQHLWLY